MINYEKDLVNCVIKIEDKIDEAKRKNITRGSMRTDL